MVIHSSASTCILQWYLNFLIFSSFITDAQLNETSLKVTAAGTANHHSRGASSDVTMPETTPLNFTVNILTARPQENVTGNHSDSEVVNSGDDTSEGHPYSNDSEPLEYIPWDELHIVKILTTTPTGVKKSAGALVQDRVVITCCRCIMLTNEDYPVSSLGIEDFVEVTRGVTGEIRYVDRMSFGIRSYCIDDPDTNIAVVLVLTKPFHVDPMRLTVGTPRKQCRFYAFSKKHSSDNDLSILGHYDLKVLIFRPRSHICRNRTVLTNRKVVCGAVFDDDLQFCKLRLGAIVICDLRFMGVSQTSCKVPYYHTTDNQTQVLSYVSILSKQELRYWHKLIALMGEGSDSYCNSIKVNYLLLVTSFILAVDTVYFYTSHADSNT